MISEYLNKMFELHRNLTDIYFDMLDDMLQPSQSIKVQYDTESETYEENVQFDPMKWSPFSWMYH